MPGHTKAWIYLGAYLAERGRHAEAEAAYRCATGLDGDRDDAFYNLGLVLRALDRLDESAAALHTALESPGYPFAKRALADVRAAIALRRHPAQRTEPIDAEDP